MVKCDEPNEPFKKKRISEEHDGCDLYHRKFIAELGCKLTKSGGCYTKSITSCQLLVTFIGMWPNCNKISISEHTILVNEAF